MINLPVQSFAYLDQQNPLNALIPGIGQGMQARYATEEDKQKIQNDQLRNALLQIQQKYQPQLDQANIASKNAYAKNAPLQTQLEQAQLAAMLQKLNQASNEPSKFQQQQILAKQAADAKAKAEQDKAWGSLLGKISDTSNAAYSLDNYADQFHQAYGNTNETGSIGGWLPAISSDAQSADRAANQMVAQLANSGLLKGGRVTNNQLAFLKGLKPSRALNSDAEVDAINQLHAVDSRLREQLPFFEKAKELGLTPDAAQQIWLKYNTEKPAYDNVNKKVLAGNFGTWNKYLPASVASPSATVSNVTPSIRWGIPGSTVTPDQQQKIMNLAKATHAPGLKNTASSNKSDNKSSITQQDLEFTAKKYGISVDDVKKRLGVS